jgi:hypothetical protein
MSDFTARFSLFPAKEKKNEKSPDRTGNIEIAEDDIQSVIAYLQTATPEETYGGNRAVKLRLAAWDTESKNGTAYLSGRVSPPLPPKADLPF